MTTFDIILLFVLGGFSFYGFLFGLISLLGSILSLVLGLWVANTFYLTFLDWTQGLIGQTQYTLPDGLGRILSFTVLFILVSRITAILFKMANKAFNILSIIPFASLVNRLLGVLFGLVEGGLILGLAFYLLTIYPWLSGFVENYLEGSVVAPYIIKSFDLVLPFLPDLWGKVQAWL